MLMGTISSSISFSLDNRKESNSLETRKVTNLQEWLLRKNLSASQVRRNVKQKPDLLQRKSEYSGSVTHVEITSSLKLI